MSYFDMFPEIDYNSKGDGKTTALKNLLTRVKLVAKVEENLSLIHISEPTRPY